MYSVKCPHFKWSWTSCEKAHRSVTAPSSALEVCSCPVPFITHSSPQQPYSQELVLPIPEIHREGITSVYSFRSDLSGSVDVFAVHSNGFPQSFSLLSEPSNICYMTSSTICLSNVLTRLGFGSVGILQELPRTSVNKSIYGLIFSFFLGK